MKSVLFIIAAMLTLWNAKLPIEAISPALKPMSECDPPFFVMGLYNPSQPNDPNPVIFDEEAKTELMSDGFQGKDKEYGDVNGDGLLDILYTTNNNELWFIPNTGSVSQPVFLADTRINTGIIGAFSFRLIDWSADGINDLVVLEKFSGDPANITLYINIASQIGFPSPAATLIDGAQVPINETQLIEMGDIDGDMFPDILISGQGSINGTAYFKFTGMGWSFPPSFTLIDPQTLMMPMIPENGGSASCPELFDADCDGDLDLFISDPLWMNGGGRVDYYENTGDGSPFLFFTQVHPNPYGLTDLMDPDMSLSCDAVVTRFVDFFGDGFPEAIAYNPCHSNHPNGDMFYYRNPPLCESFFTFELNGPCNDFVFIDQSLAGVPVTYFWDFGDPASGANNNSTLQLPSHIFSSCGSFNVCLTITGVNCADTYCQVIQVTDLVPPTAKCLSGVGIVLDTNCIAVATPFMIDDGSFDDCQIQSYTLSPDTFMQCGVFPVVLTVTDWCGNTSTCASEVQVIEDIPPVIICPANMVVTVLSPTCDTVLGGLEWIQLSDNCGIPSVSYTVTGASQYSGNGDANGLLFSQGTSIISYTAADACGNTSQCSFSVTIKCSCNCIGNIVQNPGFFEGAIPGSMGGQGSGKTDHWVRSLHTPDVAASDSCCDPYAMQMYGLGNNGESIKQQVTIVQGRQYEVTFCARYYDTGPKSPDVRFRFTASNQPVFEVYVCTNCELIGNSVPIRNTNWISYTLPVWTATRNWSYIDIGAWSASSICWGRIDNVCVREVVYKCCEDEGVFVENARNAINVYSDPSGEEAIFETGNLPNCDSIAYIDWGDGEIEVGPFAGNFVRRHRYLDHLLARIEYQVNEYPDEIPTSEACFEHIFIDSLEVGGPDTCVCLGFSGLYIRSSSGDINVGIDYDGLSVDLSCPDAGYGYDFTGAFQCGGSACADGSELTWTLTGPDGTVAGTSFANPYFGISLLPSYFSTPGLYTLNIIGQCGENSCEFITEFFIDCDDLCPCESDDIEEFRNAVDRSFARIMQPAYGCNVAFSPIALSDCETVEWYLDNTGGTPIGESVGQESFNYTFSESGTYTVIMEVTKKKKDGSTCDKQMRSQQITVTCQNPVDCSDGILFNPGFGEGAVPGSLGTDGFSEGWNTVSGEPIVVEGESGSTDGWTIQLAGNRDTADVLSRFEAFCLTKGEGLFSTTVKSSKSNGSERRFGGTLNVKLGRGWAFPPVFSLEECDSLNCFELASVQLPESDSAEWYEVQIPFDLSRWNLLDDCGGVVVRPIIYLTNALGSDQGQEGTFSYAQLDQVCFNGMLVSSKDLTANNLGIKIYPNPNTGQFTVELSNAASNKMSIRIIGLTGQVLYEKTCNPGVALQSLDVKDLSSGIYFLQVMADNRIISFAKFVKQ